MKVAVLFISLLGASVTAGPSIEQFIVGGGAASVVAYPFIGSLQKSGQHICGAVAIGPRVAITAASCTHSLAPNTLRLRFGSNYWQSGGNIVGILDVTEHNQYDPILQDYDFAILWSSSWFPNYVVPISLAPPGYQLPPGTVAQILGWGLLDDGGSSLSDTLQATDTVIVDSVDCQDRYVDITSPPNKITDQMFCAGLDATGKDSCRGDEGGPLIQGGVLHGIISWRVRCSDADHPSVYAMISSVRDWIRATCGV